MLLNLIFITKKMWLVTTIKIHWEREGGNEGERKE